MWNRTSRWAVVVAALFACAFGSVLLLQRTSQDQSLPVIQTDRPVGKDRVPAHPGDPITNASESARRSLLRTNLGSSSGAQPTPSPSPSQSWSQSLSDAEASRCRQVAWDAVKSQAMWARFKPKRITTTPIRLDPKGIQLYLGEPYDRVTVAIPSGGSLGWHPCYIGVTVARDTYEILDLYESHWP